MGSSEPTMCKLFPSHYLQCPVVHNLQPSTQYSFVEAACTTAGCQTGGVAMSQHWIVHEEDSPPGGPPDPESEDTDDIVISVYINKIINPDMSFGSSDPMCIFLLQLLVEHAAPNIHDSHKSVQIQLCSVAMYY
ncbi:hypothetical protein EMCRGX_G009418 [Ephydatia muelleri]